MADVIVAPAGRPVDYDAPNTGLLEYAKLNQMAMEPITEAMRNRRDFQQKIQAGQMDEAFRAQQQKDLLAGQAATQSNRDKYLLDAQNSRNASNQALMKERMLAPAIKKALDIYSAAGTPPPPRRADSSTEDYLNDLNAGLGGEKGVYATVVKRDADALRGIQKQQDALEQDWNKKKTSIYAKAKETVKPQVLAYQTDANIANFASDNGWTDANGQPLTPQNARVAVQSNPAWKAAWNSQLNGLETGLADQLVQKTSPEYIGLNNSYIRSKSAFDSLRSEIAKKDWGSASLLQSQVDEANELSKNLKAPTKAESVEPQTGYTGDLKSLKEVPSEIPGKMVTLPNVNGAAAGQMVNVPNVNGAPAASAVPLTWDTGGLIGMTGQGLRNIGQGLGDKFSGVGQNLADSWNQFKKGPDVGGVYSWEQSPQNQFVPISSLPGEAQQEQLARRQVAPNQQVFGSQEQYNQAVQSGLVAPPVVDNTYPRGLTWDEAKTALGGYLYGTPTAPLPMPARQPMVMAPPQFVPPQAQAVQAMNPVQMPQQQLLQAPQVQFDNRVDLSGAGVMFPQVEMPGTYPTRYPEQY